MLVLYVVPINFFGVFMSDNRCNSPVAYFSAEYGLQADLPLYAGGLGVLSGDTVKEAADQNLEMSAIGLLYRGVKYIQGVDDNGWQTESDFPIDPIESGFEHVYAPDEDEQPLFIKVNFSVKDIWCRVWKRTLNQTTLYLLDTDTDQNEPEDRAITHALYFGSEDVLIKQQLILGIGGVKLLFALGIEPCIYHVNEGRPAFLYWELISQFMSKYNMEYKQAEEKAKAMIVYTNHTLVRAGNQSYNQDLLKKYSASYAEKMGISVDELLKPGIDVGEGGKFSMTQFALNTSHKASAVSQPHYVLSKSLWPEYNWMGITNGVHMPTWQDPEIKAAKDDPEKLWGLHQNKKRELETFVKEKTGFGYDPERLVISWARRFAGYKRPNAIYDDLERLKNILSNQDRPVQFLMAGKAHALDDGAKKILQDILKIMKDLNGHAIYIPNYNMEVAHALVSGSDVWLNTPLLGKEASGTSGMKAIANGVIQLTVEDGWAAEVDWHDIGWSLDGNHLVETLYFRLEEDVVPTFYHRENGLPLEWLEMMKNSIELAEKYSAKRMLNEYKQKMYNIT